MPQLLTFPVGNAKIEIARDPSGTAIGVSVTLLVLPDDVKLLPEPFRKSAQAILYEEATK